MTAIDAAIDTVEPAVHTGIEPAVETSPQPDQTERRTASPTAPRLRVRGLSVGFRVDGHVREIVTGVDFDLAPGECVAIVGESGSGKSVTARSLVGLTGRGAVVEANELSLHREDVR